MSAAGATDVPCDTEGATLHAVTDAHDRGLRADLALLARRRALRWLLAAGAAPLAAPWLAACGGDAAPSGTPPPGPGPDLGAGLDAGPRCETVPAEIAGPFPADGSNGPNVLALEEIVRGDLRPSFGELVGLAEGVPLAIELQLVDGACAPRRGHALYLWHCDRDGAYSIYQRTDQNYLRGVQVTDDDGVAHFTTVFPGCYPGRWPHFHLEVFADAAAARAGAGLRTTQLALPDAACAAAYAAPGYEASRAQLARLSLRGDGAFFDRVDLQLLDTRGSVDDGFTARLQLALA